MSPYRYAVESFFRVISYDAELPEPKTRDFYLEILGFNLGNIVCYIAMIIIFFALIGSSWLIIVLRSRKRMV